MAIVALGVALVFVPVSRDPLAVHLVGAVIAAGGAVFVQRSLRWASIDVGPETVVVHELLRTTRFPVAAIDRFLVVRDVYSTRHDARDLALRTRHGETVVFGDFSSHAGEAEFSVDALAGRLNADIGASARQAERAGVA